MRVLIVENDPSLATAISVSLGVEWRDIDAVLAPDGESGIAMARDASPDLIVLDLELPDKSGCSLLQEIRRFSAVPIIVLTVSDATENLVRALERGVNDFLIKPFTNNQLISQVAQALRRPPLRDILDQSLSPTPAVRHREQKATSQELASIALRKVLEIICSHLEPKNFTVAKGSDEPSADLQPRKPSPRNMGWAIEGLVELLEVGRDVSTSLHGLLRIHEEWVDATVEQQCELLLVAKSIEKAVTQLADADASAWPWQ